MKPRLIDSEIDLEPQPERIAGKLHTPCREEHRVAKRGMPPSQVDLDELGPVRVHAKVNCVELVRPEVGIAGSNGDILICFGKMPGLRKAGLPESCNSPRQLRMFPSRYPGTAALIIPDRAFYRCMQKMR